MKLMGMARAMLPLTRQFQEWLRKKYGRIKARNRQAATKRHANTP
jgi:hypothetical protein